MKLMTSVPGIGLRLTGALLLAAFAAPHTAGAYYAGGGKDAAKGNDCLIGYNNVDPSQVILDGKKSVVVCTDCDPSCDLDGVTTPNGSCTIATGVCINQSGVEGCTPPSALDKASAKGKIKGVKGSASKVVIDVSQLLTGSACGALVDVLIPLKETKKSTKDGKATIKLAASVKKNKSEGLKARKDKDKLIYVCQPLPEGGSCPVPTTTTSSSTSTTVETSTTSTSVAPTTSTSVPSTTSTTFTSTTSTTVATTTSTSVPSTTSTTVATTTSTSVPSTTSTTVVSTTSTTVDTTTTTTTIPPSTTSTTTTTVTTTSTTTSLPPATVLSFRTGPAGGVCGAAKSGGSGGVVRKSLSCGGLNIGGGASTVAEGPTPDNAETQLSVSGGPVYTVSGRTAAQSGSIENCSDTGCNFGPYLPIASAGTSTCVRNTFSAPASGTLDSTTGDFTGSFPLTSTVYLTANGTFPCPLCLGGTPGVAGSGTCDATWSSGVGPSPDAGNPCKPVNSTGDSNDCNPPAGSVLPSFPVDLTPITTGTASKSDAGGIFCPMQATSGAFGCTGTAGAANAICPGGNAAPLIDYIEEVGTPAGPVTSTPTAATLASTFCIPSVGGSLGFLINGAANLPGPGATSLPGTLVLLP
jgi:hypothetical protein